MVEVHAASCEGRAADPDEPEVVLEVNLPPEEVLQVPKARPASSEPAAKKTSPRLGVGERVECPICNELYPKASIEEHAASCGEEVYV